MEIVDGEMEILAAGDWRVLPEGMQSYTVHAKAAASLTIGAIKAARGKEGGGAFAGEGEQGGEGGVVESGFFGGGLDFDDAARCCEDEVGVGVGGGVLGVV